MISTNYKSKSVLVIGRFYSIDGITSGELTASMAGSELGAWLDDAFNTNSEEDYSSLAAHDDPQIRLLVAKNFQELDKLSRDENEQVREYASFAKNNLLPVKTYTK